MMQGLCTNSVDCQKWSQLIFFSSKTLFSLLPVFRVSDSLRSICWAFVCVFCRLEMSSSKVPEKMKSQLEFQFPERWSLEARSQVGAVNSRWMAVPLFWCSEDKHPGNSEPSSHTLLQQRGQDGHLALLSLPPAGLSHHRLWWVSVEDACLASPLNFMYLQDLSSTHQPKGTALLLLRGSSFHSSTDVSQPDKSDHCAQWMEPSDSWNAFSDSRPELWHKCTFTCTHTDVHTCILVHTYTQMHIYVHKSTHSICIPIYTCARAHLTHIHINKHPDTHPHAHTCICTQ